MVGTRNVSMLVLVCSFMWSDLANGQSTAFRFLATGDLPYSAEQDVEYRRLLQQSTVDDFAFLLHVGDFKSQHDPCSDEVFIKIRDLFRQYPKPVVYTPGDNEWTDCRGAGSDSNERLQKLRELFFHDRATLRLSQLGATHQSATVGFASYVENYGFFRSGVLFLVAHVVGSGNNYRPQQAEVMREFNRRNAANIAFLSKGFSEAIDRDVPGVVIVMHANPDFEKGAIAGFKDVLSSMRQFLREFGKPVLCIHGDTHYFRIDKPFRSNAGDSFLHFTRMEVFGAPTVAGVVVTVDINDPQVFSYRPYYLK